MLVTVVICTAQNQQREQRDLVIKNITIMSSDIEDTDTYHESDDLLSREDQLMIYLNKTDIHTDTLYVYTVTRTTVQCQGTTKTGDRCKIRTFNKSGYCHMHQIQICRKETDDF